MTETEISQGFSPAERSKLGWRGLVGYTERQWLRCLVLILLGAAARLPALQGPLLWDDLYLARDNPFIKSPLLILEAFRHYLFPDSFAGHYRPVQTISYVFDYLVWNTDAYGYHLSNLLWHLGSGALALSSFAKAASINRPQVATRGWSFRRRILDRASLGRSPSP